MIDKRLSFTDYLLLEEKKHRSSRGRFTLLMTYIQEACKLISAYIKTAALQNIVGYTSEKNLSGDIVTKLDEFSNECFARVFKKSDLIYAYASEEEKDITFVNDKADYILIVDPLDGSKQSQVDLPSGTIFAIYKRDKANLLSKEHLVAAGYCLYSSSTVFVYATQDSVAMFTLDQAIGSFMLCKKDWQMPEQGSIYSTNEAYTPRLHEKDKKYLDLLKNQKYSLRYVGTLIADMHRIFLEGGVFLYPGNKKAPQGKLRSFFEVLPFGFISERLGGGFLAGNIKAELKPENIHMRSDFVAGSRKEIAEYSKL